MTDTAAIELVDVDADNWRRVAAVTPRPGQERFVAATTYYLCMCHYGDVIELLIERFAESAGAAGLGLSYDAENARARRLYASLGFVETGERAGDEIVARRLPAERTH